MRSIKSLTLALFAVLALVSCSRNPDVAKRKYLESGNKYFEKKNYKSARIMYKDAIQKDKLFGPAYYRLGLTALKMEPPSVNEAVGALRRAVELLKKEDPDHWEAVVRLSEIYLLGGRTQPQLLEEVRQFCAQLLKRDRNSFDGHRLSGDLKFVEAIASARVGRREESAKQLQEAIDVYEKANQAKPAQEGVLMQMARAYAGMRSFADAERIYRQVMAINKTATGPYTELYGILVAQNRSTEAEQVLKDGYQALPKEFRFLTALASHYSAQGRREEMIGVLQQIKSHAKDFDEAYLVVGDFYLRQGDGETAIREYREGLSKDAKKKSTYQKRIIEALMRQGKRNEAAELNSQVLKEFPNDNDAKGLAASFLLDKGEVNRALTELQAVVTRAADNPVARYNLARAYAAHGDIELARQHFTKAIELRPDYVQARLALAQLQVSKGEFESALKTAGQVLAIDRGNVNARLIESAALMGQKKFGESRALLDAMLKSNPSSPDATFQMGVVNLAENKFKEAEESFRKAYQLNPANSRGLMGMVETSIAQGKMDAALQILRAEAEKHPNWPEIRLELGNIAMKLGRYDESIAEYQKLLTVTEKDSLKRGDLFIRIGEVYRRKGDYGNAVSNLQQARSILPENVVALSALALSFDQAGRWSEAKQGYEAALKLDSNNGYILNNLAFGIAEHGGDLDDALAKAQRAKAMYPNLAEVSDTLGWIYLKKNLSDQAVDVFKDLVAKTPNHATFRYHLGMALAQKGDRTRAVKELQEALKYNPSKIEKDKIQTLLTKLGA